MGSAPEPYTLQPIPGKGKGLIATQPISPGTLLISEPPLFTTDSLTNASTIERDLGKIVKSLPKESQRAFLSLHNNNPGAGEPFTNIVRSNGYPLGPTSDVGGIFPLVSRINHSCLPNAQHAFSTKLHRMLVHVVRPIAEGEEITLSYITGGPKSERQKTLKQHFGFACQCNLCSLPSAEQKSSDDRLRKAQELDEAIGNPNRVRQTPEKALQDCRALEQIYHEERIMDLRLPRLYHDAFQICAMHSDAARARVFAERSCEGRVRCEGRESQNVEEERRLAERPMEFENFGVTGRWRSGVEDVPGGLGEEGFERWLWREL